MALERNGLIQKILVGVATAAVLGAVGVYANQARIEERVNTNTAKADQCCRESAAGTKTLVRVETRLDVVASNQEKILAKLDRLSEASHKSH